MSIKDLSVVKKIGLSYLAVFLVFAVVSVVMMSSLLSLNKNTAILTDKSLPSVALLKGIQVDITKVRKDEFSLLSNAKHPKIAEWIEGLEQWRENVQQGILSYEALALSEQEKRSFKVFKDTWNSYISETQQYNYLLAQGKAKKANEVVLSSFTT
ncbi:MCP four helix bundle domain-containing protein, partial [Vibrio sp. 10N.222.48.A3]